MTTGYAVTRLEEAVVDLRRLEDFAIERELELELASETPDWTKPQRALDAISEGMRLLSWSPYSCRKAELGNGGSRESIVPFGSAGPIVLFQNVGDDVVVGALRHQREEDYPPLTSGTRWTPQGGTWPPSRPSAAVRERPVWGGSLVVQ